MTFETLEILAGAALFGAMGGGLLFVFFMVLLQLIAQKYVSRLSSHDRFAFVLNHSAKSLAATSAEKENPDWFERYVDDACGNAVRYWAMALAFAVMGIFAARGEIMEAWHDGLTQI